MPRRAEVATTPAMPAAATTPTTPPPATPTAPTGEATPSEATRPVLARVVRARGGLAVAGSRRNRHRRPVRAQPAYPIPATCGRGRGWLPRTGKPLGSRMARRRTRPGVSLPAPHRILPRRIHRRRTPPQRIHRQRIRRPRIHRPRIHRPCIHRPRIRRSHFGRNSLPIRVPAPSVTATAASAGRRQRPVTGRGGQSPTGQAGLANGATPPARRAGLERRSAGCATCSERRASRSAAWLRCEPARWGCRALRSLPTPRIGCRSCAASMYRAIGQRTERAAGRRGRRRSTLADPPPPVPRVRVCHGNRQRA